jgi:hypothetical protein
MLLLDNSAWARRWQRAVRERFASAMEAGELGVTLPFLLEAGFSARTALEHNEIMGDLMALRQAKITPRVEGLALDAQADLARVGHHRL